MNQYLKLSAVALLSILGLAQTHADQTNVVQNLSIRLAGIYQGPTETNRNIVRINPGYARVSTADVLKQLGTATGNTFSDNAKLAVVTPLDGGNSALVVRDGTTSVEVTSFFVYEMKSGSVNTSYANLRSGRSTSSEYSIQRLALVDSAGSPALTLHFDVQGIAIQTTVTTPSTGTRSRVEADVSGSGDEAGKLLILEGTFRLDGYSLEVVATAPPPNA